jgi:hypothetical protein
VGAEARTRRRLSHRGIVSIDTLRARAPQSAVQSSNHGPTHYPATATLVSLKAKVYREGSRFPETGTTSLGVLQPLGLYLIKARSQQKIRLP